MATVKKKGVKSTKRQYLSGGQRIAPSINALSFIEKNLLNMRIQGKFIEYTLNTPRSVLAFSTFQASRKFDDYKENFQDRFWHDATGELLELIGLDLQTRTFGTDGAYAIREGTTEGLLYDCQVNIKWRVCVELAFLDLTDKPNLRERLVSMKDYTDIEYLVAVENIQEAVSEFEFDTVGRAPLFHMREIEGSIFVDVEGRTLEDDGSISCVTLVDSLNTLVLETLEDPELENYLVRGMNFKLIALGV